jgi:hypothetical protein
LQKCISIKQKPKQNRQNIEALDDVDMIRMNRGLEGSLYDGSVPSGTTAVDVVLKERRIELAFERSACVRCIFATKKSGQILLGYHLPGLKETDIDLSVARLVIEHDHATN